MITNDKMNRAKARMLRVGDRLANRGFAGIVLLGLAAGSLIGGILGIAIAGLTSLR